MTAIERLAEVPETLRRLADHIDGDAGLVMAELDQAAARAKLASSPGGDGGFRRRLRLTLGVAPGEGVTDDDIVHLLEGVVHAHDAYKERVEELLPERDALAAQLRAVRSALGQP